MIRSLSFRQGFSGLVLVVTEDHDYGTDWRGDEVSLSKLRTRDAVPNDLVELTKQGYFTPKQK